MARETGTQGSVSGMSGSGIQTTQVFFWSMNSSMRTYLTNVSGSVQEEYTASGILGGSAVVRTWIDTAGGSPQFPAGTQVSTTLTRNSGKSYVVTAIVEEMRTGANPQTGEPQVAEYLLRFSGSTSWTDPT